MPMPPRCSGVTGSRTYVDATMASRVVVKVLLAVQEGVTKAAPVAKARHAAIILTQIIDTCTNGNAAERAG